MQKFMAFFLFQENVFSFRNDTYIEFTTHCGFTAYTGHNFIHIISRCAGAGGFAMSLLELPPKHHQIETLKTYSRNRKCNVTIEKQKSFPQKLTASVGKSKV
jgi:hypothetical protein